MTGSFCLTLSCAHAARWVVVQQPPGWPKDCSAASRAAPFAVPQGYYRGANGSAAPELHFTLQGPASAFPATFDFQTFLLPGSRPAADTCHPLAPTCSLAALEAVRNATLSGSRTLLPGQTSLPPLQLPISWQRLPPESELRIGVRITPRANARVVHQSGQLAAIVFGTSPGLCPPGA